jgi:hypothetical protein
MKSARERPKIPHESLSYLNRVKPQMRGISGRRRLWGFKDTTLRVLHNVHEKLSPRRKKMSLGRRLFRGLDRVCIRSIV